MEPKPTELVDDCDDGGGGKFCGEAEGEGVVDVNDDDGIVGIDGGGVILFDFVQICKILGDFRPCRAQSRPLSS